MTDQAGQAPQERPVTYNQASSAYRPGWTAARERYDELDMRGHLSRARAKLVAEGRYDPAQHGTTYTEPLSIAEQLELMALGEYLSRTYRPSYDIDLALHAGASWPEIASALGVDQAEARQRYRDWEDGQHRLWVDYDGMFGLSDAAHAEKVARVGDPEVERERRDAAPGRRAKYPAARRAAIPGAQRTGGRAVTASQGTRPA
jgi:hypothetical protein